MSTVNESSMACRRNSIRACLERRPILGATSFEMNHLRMILYARIQLRRSGGSNRYRAFFVSSGIKEERSISWMWDMFNHERWTLYFFVSSSTPTLLNEPTVCCWVTEIYASMMLRNFIPIPTESPEIGKGGWPGTAELAAVQPTVRGLSRDHAAASLQVYIVCITGRRVHCPTRKPIHPCCNLWCST